MSLPIAFKFWDQSLKPRPVWAIFTERGECRGWAVSKRAAQRSLDKQSNMGALRLVRLVPHAS